MKFYGFVGYCETVEGTGDKEGVWIPDVVEKRHYTGDVIRNQRRMDSNSESINENLTVSNTISIVADAYAYEHFFAIRFVEWMGALWRVTSVEVQRPRLILTIGGVYNGPSS